MHGPDYTQCLTGPKQRRPDPNSSQAVLVVVLDDDANNANYMDDPNCNSSDDDSNDDVEKILTFSPSRPRTPRPHAVVIPCNTPGTSKPAARSPAAPSSSSKRRRTKPVDVCLRTLKHSNLPAAESSAMFFFSRLSESDIIPAKMVMGHEDLALKLSAEGDLDAHRFRLNLTVGSNLVLDDKSL